MSLTKPQPPDPTPAAEDQGRIKPAALRTGFPHLCAHRGLSQACPENTLPAFAAAMAVGAHEIEFDLWASRDGVLVVCHDATVDRTTEGTGRISELTWHEIRSLDAGIRSGAAWRGVRMPRLEEVLAFAEGRIGLNVHLKETGPDNAALRQVCDRIAERGLTGIAYLALGTEAALQAAIEYAPEIPRACLANSQDPDLSIDVAARTACQRIQFRRHVTAEQVRRAHELGLICNLFWSDDPQEGRTYVRNGIDVILTNCAHFLIAGGFASLRARSRVQPVEGELL